MLLASCGAVWAQPDARETVRRSIAADEQNEKLVQNYTWKTRQVWNELDGKGNVKSTRIQVREVLFIGSKRHRRLLEEDGKPLTPDRERKEREKMDKALADAQRMSASDRAKAADAYRQRRAKERESLQAVPEAFDCTLVKQESLGGRDAYVIDLRPRPGYKGPHHDFLSKLQGRLWIDKLDYHWIKAEAETLDTISFGLFSSRPIRRSLASPKLAGRQMPSNSGC